jgi:hypothetical protein
MPFVFSHTEYCDLHFVYGLCNDHARAAVKEYGRRFPDWRILSKGVFSCVRQTVHEVPLCILKGKQYVTLTYERTFLRWFKEVQNFPLLELPLASVPFICIQPTRHHCVS